MVNTGYFWTEDRDVQILDMWRERHSASYIAKQIGCTRNAVSGRLLRLRAREGIMPHRRRGVQYSVEEDNLIASMRKQDVQVKDIAAKLGRPVYSVFKRAQKIGVSTRMRNPDKVLWSVRKESSLGVRHAKRVVSVPMTKIELYAMLQQAVLNTGGELV